ncbi:hypothetical protein LTR36_001182 [Oleoguttula mirabilis]|uniref:BTB domain-containing protein n=1 Tax=Oleoguttula mirabilis TaxID=1507867 RepID=A0AAV9J3N8_9PEZI|nr:hypothetical protein LTR36_001182 [Oleoguttula mirabilis]
MAPQTFSQLLGTLKDDGMITIVAGEGQETYKVQRALLINASPWFGKALGGGFKESQDRTLRFPGVREEVVQAFVAWLFQYSLPLNDLVEAAEEEDIEDDDEWVQEEMRLVVRLWAFGEQYMLPRLQNAAMRELYKRVRYVYPDIDIIKEAYECSPPKSTLRKLMMRDSGGRLEL